MTVNSRGASKCRVTTVSMPGPTRAAGLTAALAAATAGARVGLYEKGERVGGTTALSSAVAWLPANRYAAQAGIADSREDALAYLSALSHGLIRPELAEAFVDTVPELLDWLDEQTPLRMRQGRRIYRRRQHLWT